MKEFKVDGIIEGLSGSVFFEKTPNRKIFGIGKTLGISGSVGAPVDQFEVMQNASDYIFERIKKVNVTFENKKFDSVEDLDAEDWGAYVLSAMIDDMLLSIGKLAEAKKKAQGPSSVGV